MKPLLSICIPTHNRAELLRLALSSLVPQVEKLSGEVEIIVSDNCSSDHTGEVVQSAMQYGSIQYHRNSQNIGATRNCLILVNDLARGEFCWIIGDDDMVVKGKVAKLVNILKGNPNTDYFFVNYFFKSREQRNLIIQEQDSVYVPEQDECMCMDFSERHLSQWEQLLSIDNVNPPAMFTAILCHVFRRSLWCAKAGLLSLRNNEPFSSFDNTFPHIKILAHAMVGKPAFYIGDPMVLMGQGSQEWIGYWPVISLVRMDEALALYEELGVDAKQISHCRKIFLQQCRQLFTRMRTELDMPGREYFSLRRFLWRNRHHPMEMVKMSVSVLRAGMHAKTTVPTEQSENRRITRTIYNALRIMKRQALELLGRS